jgi:hypothetical protein
MKGIGRLLMVGALALRQRKRSDKWQGIRLRAS